MKRLTGRDRIKARRMREDFWQSTPSQLREELDGILTWQVAGLPGVATQRGALIQEDTP